MSILSLGDKSFIRLCPNLQSSRQSTRLPIRAYKMINYSGAQWSDVEWRDKTISILRLQLFCWRLVAHWSKYCLTDTKSMVLVLPIMDYKCYFLFFYIGGNFKRSIWFCQNPPNSRQLYHSGRAINFQSSCSSTQVAKENRSDISACPFSNNVIYFLNLGYKRFTKYCQSFC